MFLLSFQSFLDRSSFSNAKVDGERETEVLASKLQQRFHDKIVAVERIKTAVENAYRDKQVASSPVNPECCRMNLSETDHRFKTKVSFNTFCEVRAEFLSKDAKYLSKTLEETMIKNLDTNPDLKWQYFGSQEGVFSTYPAHQFPSCTSYDNRLRPWYVEGIAPQPKDIVLIIDKSGSMEDIFGHKTLFEIAITSAESVLNSLNFNDRVSDVNSSKHRLSKLSSDKKHRIPWKK